MHISNNIAATPPLTSPPPTWPLRSEAAELRAVILASRKGVGIYHARAIDDLRQGRRA